MLFDIFGYTHSNYTNNIQVHEKQYIKNKKIQDFYKSWIFVGSKGFEPLTNNISYSLC